MKEKRYEPALTQQENKVQLKDESHAENLMNAISYFGGILGPIPGVGNLCAFLGEVATNMYKERIEEFAENLAEKISQVEARLKECEKQLAEEVVYATLSTSRYVVDEFSVNKRQAFAQIYNKYLDGVINEERSDLIAFDQFTRVTASLSIYAFTTLSLLGKMVATGKINRGDAFYTENEGAAQKYFFKNMTENEPIIAKAMVELASQGLAVDMGPYGQWAPPSKIPPIAITEFGFQYLEWVLDSE